MSTSNQTTDIYASNFTAIFDAALQEYKALTKQDLGTHPFAAALEGCDSPDTIMGILRNQSQVFDKFREGDDKLMTWLTPIVNILFTFSATLGEGIGLPFSPGKTIITGFGVLLGAVKDVIASYEALVYLFERIQFFIQRLNHYTAVPLTPEMTLLLGKIMAQVLSVLALSTKAMKERRIKKYIKSLVGKKDVEEAFQRLDMLTKEENLMMAARNLEATYRVDDKVTTINQVVHDIDSNVNVTRHAMNNLQRNQWREQLRAWLSPPNPSINHNTASAALHEGTTSWFIRDSRFDEWKKDGSLLWIRGNPGSGKTVLCSAIIEDIKHVVDSRSTLIAYYYFDFKDDTKRDLRGLLASLLFQLADDSDLCGDTLFQLYKLCRSGSDQPSEHMLTECLKTVLDLPEQVQVYVIVDALDECPDDTEIPSAREKVLKLLQDLVQSNLSKLFLCVISRPESDISTILNSLTSPSRRVSLHEEVGQREDINTYIRFVVQNDFKMQKWRGEDKELVINTLSKRAAGMFRWVYCQLNALRQSLPSSIRRLLNELPITLHETYERILQGIPREKRQHANRLFHCMVAALRPLRVEELAEIFAIEFGANAAASELVEDWRPEDPEDAVLSTCSTLIAIIDDRGSKIVQFSHFTVKEFLTSGHLRDHLRTTSVPNLCHYYIPLESAHAILARACLTILVQLDGNVNKERLATFPLALYAAQTWVDHARFEKVASQIEDFMECLFNPKDPYFRAWVWIHDIDRASKRSMNFVNEHPPLPKATPLYYAVSCGFRCLAKRLIVAHAEDVNARCGRYGTPLHAASSRGHVDVARVLLDHGADENARNQDDESPLSMAYYARQLEIMQLLLERGASIESPSYFFPVSLFDDASADGWDQAVQLLLKYGAGR